MTLYKNVDGVQVALSDQEESTLRTYWAMNEKYPLYQGVIAYDGSNDPYILMDDAKAAHKSMLSKACQIEMQELTKQIEMAQEDGLDASLLLAKRKAYRTMADMDLSSYTSLDELIASVPQDLKKYWQQ